MNRNLDYFIKQLKDLKPEIIEKYSVNEISIFGSFARDKATKDSDLDILVSFSDTPDLFDLASLNIFLEEQLGIKVDLVPDINLKPIIAKSIYTEKIDVV
jgi:uncharacterized protein